MKKIYDTNNFCCIKNSFLFFALFTILFLLGKYLDHPYSGGGPFLLLLLSYLFLFIGIINLITTLTIHIIIFIRKKITR